MKKIKQFIMLFMVFALSTVISPIPISANNVNITLARSGIIKRGYYEAKNSKGDIVKTGDGYNVEMIYVNGIEVFCIEPEVLIGGGGGYTVNSFNHADREMFSRIIYHGYDNTNKTNKDWVVTQHVLWNYIDSIRSDLTINTGWYFDGFDYNAEKTIIMNKVNAHNKSASFHNTMFLLL